jgi:hypothetical protein
MAHEIDLSTGEPAIAYVGEEPWHGLGEKLPDDAPIETWLRWLLAGKVSEPRRVSHAGQEIRVWTDRDVKRVQKYKQENYRKGRGRKPKPQRWKKQAGWHF